MAKMGGFDMRGLKNLQQNLNKIQESQVDAFCEACAKELAARLLRKVTRRTPVRSGTLRSRWTFGAVKKEGDSYKIEISNSILYASYVEFGHRTSNHKDWVKGQFMMTISEQELEQIAPKVLENKIKNFLRSVFN